MFCKVCGTVNKDSAEVCVKCAHDLRNPVIEGQTLTQMSTRLGPENTAMGKGLGGISRTTRIIIYVTFAAIIIILPVFFIASSMNGESSKLGQLGGGPTEIPAAGGTLGAEEGGGVTAPRSPSEAMASQGDISRITNAQRIQTALEVYASDYGPFPDTLDEIAENLDFDLDLDIYEYSIGEQSDYTYELRTVLGGVGVGLSESETINEDGVIKYLLTGGK